MSFSEHLIDDLDEFLNSKEFDAEIVLSVGGIESEPIRGQVYDNESDTGKTMLLLVTVATASLEGYTDEQDIILHHDGKQYSVISITNDEHNITSDILAREVG